MDGDRHQQSRLFNELCALIFSILRSPHLFFPSAPPPLPSLRSRGGAMASVCRPQQRSQFTPAGLASLLLGASLALILCGSVTFVLGCILMPWVIGFVMFLYFLGVVSNLSGFGRAILCSSLPSPVQISPEELSDQFFSKVRTKL